MNKIILDLCGGTGSWSKPYKNNGYSVYNLTFPDYDITDFSTFPIEVINAIQENNVYGILAAPPCTQFSIARNDKTAKKKRNLEQGMEVVKCCLNIIWLCQYKKYRINQGLKFWCLENPASGYLKRFLGKPVLEFEPYEYGDTYTKFTALWGNFNNPKKNIVKPISGTMVKYASNFKELKLVNIDYQKKTGIDSRTIRRSITPQGFAQLFYEENK